MQEIKAKAFDLLMEKLKDKGEKVRSYERLKPFEMRDIARFGLNLQADRELVEIYQWKINLANSRDLEKALLDEAEMKLKKEIKE